MGILRSIKNRMSGMGHNLLKQSHSEEMYIQDCKEAIHNGTGDSILCFTDNSLREGHEAIQAELDRREITPLELHEDIDEMTIRLKDVPSAFSLFYRKRQIRNGIRKSYEELKQNNQHMKPPSREIPDNKLWDALNEYARDKWGIIKIGFTKLPKELIFQGRYVLFPYALIFIDEMRKERIKMAPLAPAGAEAVRIYAHLGSAVNDIARWLRSNGIKCQPQHPLGGLTLTPPLAAKAGLGWQGKQGLLITPEFGVRQRIAPIFIESPVFEFTDSFEHKWIENYCTTCGLCAKRCPGKAILNERIISADNIEGIGQIRTSTEIMKCFEHFDLHFGCSVCVKVCPFSQGSGSYERIKSYFEKRNQKCRVKE